MRFTNLAGKRQALLLATCALLAFPAVAPARGGPVTLTWGGDVTLVNYEGTFAPGGPSKCGGGSPNCFAFQAPARNARTLRRSGVDAVNLANNHAYDYGALGYASTRRALRRAGANATGAPGEIRYMRRNRTRLALVGFSTYRWSAPLNDGGAVRRLVRRAARRADIVIVLFHAGAEGADRTHVPHGHEHAFGEDRGHLRAFARIAIGAGGDVVLGSGPHVLRGLELYRRRLIAYSLGNLAGWRNFNTSGGLLSLSALVTMSLSPTGRFRRGGGGSGDEALSRRLGVVTESRSSPVDRHDGSGHEAGLVREQERHDGRDLVRVPDPAERVQAREFLLEAGRAFGRDRAECHSIDPDAVAAMIDREAAREALHGRLRRRVRQRARHGTLRLMRRHVDDRSRRARRKEAAHRDSRTDQREVEVHVDAFEHIADRVGAQARIAEDRRVVHPAAQAAGRFGDVGSTLGIAGVPGVTHDAFGSLVARRPLQEPTVTLEDHDRVAVGEQPLGHRAPDAPPSTCHHIRTRTLIRHDSSLDDDEVAAGGAGSVAGGVGRPDRQAIAAGAERSGVDAT